MSEWIDCKVKMPEIEQEILCVDEFGNYEAAIYTMGYIKNGTPFFAITAGEFHPSHWMPLPELPNGKQ